MFLQFGADFSVKSPRVYAHRLLQFLINHCAFDETRQQQNNILNYSENSPSYIQKVVYSDQESFPEDNGLNPSAGKALLDRQRKIAASAMITRFCYSNEELHAEISVRVPQTISEQNVSDLLNFTL